MFKNNKKSILIVSVLVLSLSLGLMAFSPVAAQTPDNGDGPSGTNGPGGPGGQGGPGGPGGPNGEFSETRQALGEYIDRDTFMANVLGISVEELQSALESGQRIPDLLETYGI